MDGQTTILLVEDQAVIALAERQLLQRSGYGVVLAHTGEAAVEAIAREPAIDLVLMDIDLGPGMDGPEAARLILGQRDLPLVFLSGHVEPEIVAKTEGISSYGYIVKNSGETVLLASIKMAFKLFAARTELRDREAHYHSLFEDPYEAIWLEDFSRLKEALRAPSQAGEAGFRAWLAEKPERIFELSELVRILDLNQAALGSIGLKDRSAIPLNLRAFLGPESREFFTNELCAIAAGRTSFEALITVAEARDRPSSFFLRLDAVQGHEADMSRVQVRLMDITATQEARERLGLLSFAMDQSPISVVITNLDGEMVYLNARCLEITGYSREEALGKTPRLFKSGETPPQTYAELWRTIAAGGTWRGLFHNRRKDGSLYWEDARILGIRNNLGGITHYLAVKEEVSGPGQA